MRKLLLSSAMLAALMSTASPALADLAEGAPPPPEYEVTEDGTLIIGGDVFVSCREIGGPDDNEPFNPQVQVEIDQAAAEERQACREAGFPTYGDAPLPPQQYEQAPGDLNCEDFASQAEAQAALREDPSDPNGLDGPPGPVGTGEPGVACEGALPGPVDFEPVANEGVVPGSGVTSVEDVASAPAAQYGQAGDIYCEDFFSREESQAALDAEPGSTSGLDADGDGLACEEVISAPPTQVDVPDDSEGCDESVAQTGRKIYCGPFQDEPSARETPETSKELPATGGLDTTPSFSTGMLLTGLGVLALGARRRKART